MNNQEYKQKRRECWEEYKRENLDGEVQWQPVSRYDVFCAAFDRAYALGKQEIKQEIKQEKDAEGEVMLTVSRKRVQEVYAKNIAASNSDGHNSYDYGYYDGVISILFTLFGSKCLPDDVDSLDSNVDSLEPKPAEPKFNLGDIVRFKYCCTTYRIDGFKMSDGVMLYQVGEVWAEESDLEPYTEQEASTCTYDCSSQCTSPDHIADASKKADDDLCYKLMRRGFRDHNRLNIATRIATAILGNPNEVYRAKTCGKGEQIPQNIAEYAVAIADALMAEAEKGGLKLTTTQHSARARAAHAKRSATVTASCCVSEPTKTRNEKTTFQ